MEPDMQPARDAARALFAEGQRGNVCGLTPGAASPEQHAAERSSPLVIRGFLSAAEMAQVHVAGAAATAMQAQAQPCERTGAMELAARFGMGSRTHTVGFLHRDSNGASAAEKGWSALSQKLTR
jgi:hypothetical protein